jgi:hypothetical protein
MRNLTIIGLTAIAAFVLAWMLLSRMHMPSSASAPPAKVSAPARPPVAPKEPALPPPAAAPSPATAETASVPANPANPATAAPNPEPAKPTADAAESPSDEDAAPEPPAQTNDDADNSTEEDSQSSADDVDHAADLLADWMARQDAAGGDEVPPSTTALRTFDQENPDPDWSGPSAQQIEATLGQWVAALPDDVRDHIQIIHIECRETFCQILAADNDPASQSQRANSSQEWQQAIATLPQQPWWSEFGFVDSTTAVNNDTADGYLLYQTYLRREVQPPE